jgi:hypothetical protein
MSRMRLVGPSVLFLYLCLVAASLVVIAPMEAKAIAGRPVAKPAILMLPQIITILVAHMVLVTGALGVYVATARWLLRIPAHDLPAGTLFGFLGAGHGAFAIQATAMLASLAYIGYRAGWNMLDGEAVHRSGALIAKMQYARSVCWLLLFLCANVLIARHVSRGVLSMNVAFGLPVLVVYLVVELLTI